MDVVSAVKDYHYFESKPCNADLNSRFNCPTNADISTSFLSICEIWAEKADADFEAPIRIVSDFPKCRPHFSRWDSFSLVNVSRCCFVSFVFFATVSTATISMIDQ
jgi:hypothetical protein